MRSEGMVILEKNYRLGPLEVDLIAMDGETLVVVEVKARKVRMDMHDISHVIPPSKQQRMIRVAEAYASTSAEKFEDIRFDYALVYPHASQYHCTYIKGAFIP